MRIRLCILSIAAALAATHAALAGPPSDAVPTGLMRYLWPAIWSFVGLVVLGTLAVVWLLVRRRMATMRELMVVATRPVSIRYSLTNTPSTIEHCFSGEVGYNIKRIKSLKALERRITSKAPDVVLVDWEFSPQVADDVEITMVVNPSTIKIPLIYYNVPDPAEAAKRKARLQRVYYLGSDITDRDVFKIVQQQTQGVTVTSIQRKGTDGSAIEGDLSGDEGLGSVMQLLEIGQKNGCLLIRRENPVGVIYFEAGNPVYARTAAQLGEKAVYELLDLKSGQFRFMADQKAPERNCSISTMGILMEHSRTSDEARKR